MLDFYGVRLKDETTGELERSDAWQAQYSNLNSHGHNNLRITRILKCLGEFDYEHYKEQFMKFYVTEIFENGKVTNCSDSCELYWLGTLKSDKLRAELEEKINKIKESRAADRKVQQFQARKPQPTWMLQPSDSDSDGDEMDDDDDDGFDAHEEGDEGKDDKGTKKEQTDQTPAVVGDEGKKVTPEEAPRDAPTEAPGEAPTEAPAPKSSASTVPITPAGTSIDQPF